MKEFFLIWEVGFLSSKVEANAKSLKEGVMIPLGGNIKVNNISKVQALNENRIVVTEIG